MRTIGVIGGMTWTSSLEYYRQLNRLVRARLGGTHSARVVLWSVDFAEHLDVHAEGGWPAVADEAITIARRLEAAGAELLIMAVNTLHRVYDEVAAASEVPLLHIADATADAVAAAGLQRVGLLGTGYTMTESFYRERLLQRQGIETLVPSVVDRDELNSIIFGELARERYEEKSRRRCLGIMDELAARGAEGIVLGCTELPLLLAPLSTSLPTFDTVALHVAAAVDLALA